MDTDFLIIGAGFAGLVAAERLTNAGFRCVVVDQRNHIGGNAHDCYDDAGVLIHRYGPHYFRTNSPGGFEYLSKFTQWHHVDYTIKSHSEDRYLPGGAARMVGKRPKFILMPLSEGDGDQSSFLALFGV